MCLMHTYVTDVSKRIYVAIASHLLSDK